MSTGIICKIKLDPFLQEFLRGYYQCNNTVFKFPREDGAKLYVDELGVASYFKYLLKPAPADFKPIDYGNYTFMIEVPKMDMKDPFYCNYISEKGQRLFEAKIHRAYRFQFHDEMEKHRSAGWDYKDCIELFMDDFNIMDKHTDRLTKDFQRWRNLRRRRKFLSKQL